MGFLFGVYPGGAAGNDGGGLASGAPDDPASVQEALDELQGSSTRPFLVRCYAKFSDATGPEHPEIVAPLRGEQYAISGRMLDLVLMYHSNSGDVAGYTHFVRNAVARFGAITRTLQIAEEPNVTGNPMLDGYYPDIQRAIVAGVPAARDEARRLGISHLKIGTNTTPLFGPSAGFYTELAHLGGRPLIDALDYIGLDMFPGVFRPISEGSTIRTATAALLRYHREKLLMPAGLGHLPLHITEHGWPTGLDCTPQQQAAAIKDVVETVRELEQPLNIGAYELFSLRDADSGNPDSFHQFGIMTDTYLPKPAYDVLQRLIEG